MTEHAAQVFGTTISSYHIMRCTGKAARKTLGPGHALFVAGEHDTVAPPDKVLALANEGSWCCNVVEGAGYKIIIK